MKYTADMFYGPAMFVIELFSLICSVAAVRFV
jgi:hypothetical protein